MEDAKFLNTAGLICTPIWLQCTLQDQIRNPT